MMALEVTCKAYCPAISAYLPAPGCELEEARDFIRHILSEFITEGDLHKVPPEAGRLRSYMMQAMRNH